MADFYIISGGINNGNNRQYLTGEFLVFDAVPEQSLTLSQDVTSYPIEGGSNISDNVSSRNDIFKLTGYISNYHSREIKGNAIGYDIKRTEAAVKLLRKIKEAKQLLTIATEFEVLDNCVLTEVGFSQTAQTSEAIPFVLTFERLRFAEKKYVTLDISKVASGTGTVAGDSAKDAKKDSANTTAGGVNKQTKLSRVQKAYAVYPESASKSAWAKTFEATGTTYQIPE